MTLPTILAAGGNILGSLVANQGAQGAANTAAGAALRSGNIMRDMYGQGREDLAPWRTAGANALGQMAQMTSAGPGTYQPSPNYEFQKAEALKQLNQSLAARGLRRSGGHVKEAGRIAAGLGSQDWDAWLQRYYDRLAPYESLSQAGQGAGAQLGRNALLAGQQIGRSIADAGQYQAAGQMGQANTLAGIAQFGAEQVADYLAGNAVAAGAPAASGAIEAGTGLAAGAPAAAAGNALSSGAAAAGSGLAGWGGATGGATAASGGAFSGPAGVAAGLGPGAGASTVAPAAAETGTGIAAGGSGAGSALSAAAPYAGLAAAGLLGANALSGALGMMFDDTPSLSAAQLRDAYAAAQRGEPYWFDEGGYWVSPEGAIRMYEYMQNREYSDRDTFENKTTTAPFGGHMK